MSGKLRWKKHRKVDSTQRNNKTQQTQTTKDVLVCCLLHTQTGNKVGVSKAPKPDQRLHNTSTFLCFLSSTLYGFSMPTCL